MKRSRLAVLPTLLLAACSGFPPVIEEYQWRVVLRDDGLDRYEELILFVRVSDPDDDEDPAEISVLAGETDFLWTYSRSEWMPVDIDGEPWWGLPGIVAYGGPRLPDVLYTLKLVDLAGRETEKTFRLPRERRDIDDGEWPRATLINGRLEYSGEIELARLILRSANGELVDILPITDDMRFPETDAAWWEIWTGRSSGTDGFRLGPYALTDTE